MHKSQIYKSELDRFVKEFDTEDKLRQIIADLLVKMGREEVRITHGPAERGKDIIFYAPGGLGERRLYACVIKNKAINGKITSSSGAKAALDQAEQAFDEPHVNLKGEEEWVDCVYIISPYECSVAAIESVKGRIKKRGQVDFICGRGLLDLFTKFWPEFLWFESGILQNYLIDLQKGLENDKALINIILRKNLFSDAPNTLFKLYVPPIFYKSIDQFDFTVSTKSFDFDNLFHELCESDLNDIIKYFKKAQRILSTSNLWENDKEDLVKFKNAAKFTPSLIRLLKVAWKKAVADYTKKNTNNQNTPKSPIIPLKKPISLNLTKIEKRKIYDNILIYNNGLIKLKKQVDDVSKIVRNSLRHSLIDNFIFLQKKECLDYCNIYDTACLVPFAIKRGDNLGRLTYNEYFLDHWTNSILIVGPAGHGKTTFCRWSAVRDAIALFENRSNILPIYLPLHGLSFGKIGSFENTFFKNHKLRQIVQVHKQNNNVNGKIRLYLDGLDEITREERRREVVELVRKAVDDFPNTQVIITSRDHAVGQLLGWLPKIEISAFSDAQVNDLATKWLDNDPVLLKRFFNEIQKTKSLSTLMHIPLLGTLILALFRRVKELPPGKVKLFELFVDLLCGGWDTAKEVKRECRFGAEDKLIILNRLAVKLHFNGKRDATEVDIKQAIEACLPHFSEKFKQVIKELLEDGLLVKFGTNFTFCHLSFQEYLVARDLNDPKGIRANQALDWFYGGDDWWREVISFYIGMSIRPIETEQWLLERAKLFASGRKNADIIIMRFDFLKGVLNETFKGYKTVNFPYHHDSLDDEFEDDEFEDDEFEDDESEDDEFEDDESEDDESEDDDYVL